MVSNDEIMKEDEEYIIDEVISPIFGGDINKHKIKMTSIPKPKTTKESVSALERYVEETVIAKGQIEKSKSYESTVNNKQDILEKYQNEKREQSIIDTLPSNYLDFKERLDKETISLDENNKTQSHTIRYIVDEIFEEEIEE